MPIIRNPFSKRVAGDLVADESGHPASMHKADGTARSPRPHPGTLDIGSKSDQQPTEYKLSEINDSGVFLPPSPTAEKPRFWSSRSHSSTTSSSQRSAFADSDSPFTISRESFDSYRRSFDISARSPVLAGDVNRGSHSLEARRFRMPLPALHDDHVHPPESRPEERFEDIGLNEELEAARPKRTGIFSRFTHSTHDPYNLPAPASDLSRPGSSSFGSQLFGRRRGPGTQGAELGNMAQGLPERPE